MCEYDSYCPPVPVEYSLHVVHIDRHLFKFTMQSREELWLTLKVTLAHIDIDVVLSV